MKMSYILFGSRFAMVNKSRISIQYGKSMALANRLKLHVCFQSPCQAEITAQLHFSV